MLRREEEILHKEEGIESFAGILHKEEPSQGGPFTRRRELNASQGGGNPSQGGGWQSFTRRRELNASQGGGNPSQGGGN